MKVKEDSLFLCSDCTMVACNGPRGIELFNETATLEGLSKLGPNLVPNFDSETGDGILEFSWLPCESCDCSLAGYRARFAVLESD